MSEQLYRAYLNGDAYLNGEYGTILSLLRDPSCDLHYQDPKTGDTILHAAIHFFQNKPVIDKRAKFLIEILTSSDTFPKDIYQTPNHNGYIPLALALQKSNPNVELARIIHQKSNGDLVLAPIRTRNNPNPARWEHLLYWAVANQEYELLKFYIASWKCSSSLVFPQSPLKLAIEKDDTKAISILIGDVYNTHEMIQYYFDCRLVDNRNLTTISKRLRDLDNISERIAHYEMFILKFNEAQPEPITEEVIALAPQGFVSATYRNYIIQLRNLRSQHISQTANSTIALLKNKTQLKKQFLYLALDCALSYFEQASRLTSALQSEFAHFYQHILIQTTNNALILHDLKSIKENKKFSTDYKNVITSIMLFYNEFLDEDFNQEIIRKAHLLTKFNTETLNTAFSSGCKSTTAQSARQSVKPSFSPYDDFGDEFINHTPVRSLQTLGWSLGGKKEETHPVAEKESDLFSKIANVFRKR